MSRGSVTVTSQALWRLRLRREAPRHLLHAVAAAGLIASARYAIAPPPATVLHVPVPASLLPDRAAESFASLFARRYLGFQAGRPEAHRQAMAAYLNAEMEPDAGFQPPEGVSQRVQWTDVVAAEAQAGGRERYTVAVQTDRSGLLYLSVGVVRGAGGGLSLDGYPAIVGPPPIAPAPSLAQLREVTDAALTTVLGRALRNYVAGSESELAADLVPGVHIAAPTAPLALEAIQSLGWEPDGRSVLALLRARDSAGGRYTLAYRVDVLAAGDRWEISGIELGSG